MRRVEPPSCYCRKESRSSPGPRGSFLGLPALLDLCSALLETSLHGGLITVGTLRFLSKAVDSMSKHRLELAHGGRKRFDGNAGTYLSAGAESSSGRDHED